MSITATIRDGVVTDLNAAGTAYFGATYPFTAAAAWFVAINQTDETLRVDVVADQMRTIRASRGSLERDCDILVHMQRKLSIGAAESGQADDLTTILEKIENYYYQQRLRVSTVPASLIASNIQLPMRKHLKDGGRWYGWARLTFRVFDQ